MIKNTLKPVMVTLAFLAAMSWTTAQDFDFAMDVSGDGSMYTLTAGFSSNATDGYDDGIDSYSPPAPPPPAFDAALTWGGDRYYTQILAGDGDLSEHVYGIALAYGGDNLITLTWDNTGFSDMMTSCVLQDAFGGAFVNIDMITGDGFANAAFASWDGTTLSVFNAAVNTLNLKVTPTDYAPPSNEPPVANAGDDQTVDEDGTGIAMVTLDGSGSFDSDGTIETYNWSENLIGIGSGVNLTVSLDVGIHAIMLTVFDDDGATDIDEVIITVNESAVDLPDVFFSEYAEGSSNNKYLEIYNGTGDAISLDNYVIFGNYNGNPFSEAFTFSAGATLASGDVYVIANSSASDAILALADEALAYGDPWFTAAFNGDDVRALAHIAGSDTSILDIIGTLDADGDGVPGEGSEDDPGGGFDVAGVSEATKDHTLVRKDEVASGNAGDWASSAGTNEDDSEYIVAERPTADYTPSTLGWHIEEPSPFATSWRLAPQAGALAVGPNPNDGSWWSNSEDDVITRACLFDDEYVFHTDGTFENILQDETWIEPWQGMDPEGCGAPVAPHDGSNLASTTFSISGDGNTGTSGTIDLHGVGSYLGLAKAINGGELSSPDDAPESITYNVEFSDAWETMTVLINIGSGYWTFTLKTSESIDSDPCAGVECGEWEECIDGECVPIPSVDVTFNIDMSDVETSAEGVFIAGGGTFGNPGDNPMSDADGDDNWTITVTLPANLSTDYTFLNGNCGDWSCKENIAGQDCAVPPYSDRHIDLGTEDVTVNGCFAVCGDGSCDELEPPATYNVTFQLTDAPCDGNPWVTGSMDGWSGWGAELSDGDGDGIFTATMSLFAQEAAYEYKYTCGGWDQQEDVPDECALGEGLTEYNNRHFLLGEADLVLDAHGWGGCAGDEPPPPGDPNFAFDIDVSSSESNLYILTAGFSPDATDGFDTGIDSYAPPAPPPPAFDAALTWDGDRYYTQILNGSIDDLVEHEYGIALAYDTNNWIGLSWDNTGWSDLMSSCVLQDAFGGALGIDIDMLSETSLSLDNPAFNSLILKVTPAAGTDEPDTFPVTFTVVDDGNDYQDVELKGSMTNWATVDMNNDGTGTWTLTLDLESGSHEWGAIENDGSEWGIWLPSLAGFDSNPIVVVGPDGSISGDTGFTVPCQTCADEYDVTFQLTDAPCAGNPWMTGTMDNWSGWGAELSDGDGDGVYTATMTLFASDIAYEYKYTCGGWDQIEDVPDECAYNTEWHNRGFFVTDVDVVLDSHPWSGCPGDEPPAGDPDFAFDVNVSGEGNTYTMTAGFSPNATDGYDDGIDSYAPPAPPPPAFDAALTWGGDRYYTQILNGSADDLVEHEYGIALAYGPGNLIELSWDNTGWSDLMSACVLQDAFGGALGIDIDMLSETSLTLDNPAFNNLILKVTPAAGGGGPPPSTPALFFSEAAEGSSNNKYLEIYNGTDGDVDLGAYSLSSCNNGCDEEGVFDYPNNVTFESGTVLAAGDVYVVCHGSASDGIQAECDYTFTYLSNGDDAFALTDTADLSILDIIGDLGPDPGGGWTVAGVDEATKDHTLVRKDEVMSGNAGDWASSAGTNEDDSEYIVAERPTADYTPATLGWHIIPPAGNWGCLDPDALNYDPESDGCEDGSNDCCDYYVPPAPLTIYEIQGQADASPFIDVLVYTTGVVTGITPNGFWLQDGTGAWNGIWVYFPSPEISIGDNVAAVGTVIEYYDLTEIMADEVIFNSGPHDLPASEEICTGCFTEAFESVLVVATGECDNNDLGYGEWSIDDGSGPGMVDDKMYAPDTIYVGDTYQVAGPLDYAYGNFKIQPRDGNDVINLSLPGPDFSVSLDATASAGTYTMAVGFSPGATDGYDEDFDTYAPPAPPPPAFDAAIGWDNDRYFTQIVAGMASDWGAEHVFDVQLQYDTDDPITLTWDNTGWAGLGSFHLTDAFDGELGIDIDMTTVNSLTLDNPAFNLLKLKVTPGAPLPPGGDPDFAFDVNVSGEGNMYIMTAGFSPDATDGYDDGIDSYAPPAPPPPAFDAALGWSGDRYYTQILNGSADDLVEHVFDVQLQYAADNLITLTWDNTGWSNLGTFILQDAFDGALGIDIDMTVENSLTLDNPALNLLKLKVTPAEQGPPPETVDLTFNLDMSDVETSPDGVFLAGGGTFGSPGDNPMSDENGDDIWTITVTLPSNLSTDYTFLNGNCPDWSCKENIGGQDCAVPPYNDRHIDLGEENVTVNACFAVCGDGFCDELEPPSTYSANFSIDMNDSDYPNADYSSVVINGSWNGWGAWGVELSDSDEDGVFTGTLEGLADDNAYEFVIAVTGAADGWSGWGVVINAPIGGDCWNGNEEYANYIFTVSGADVDIAYCAGTCDEACEAPPGDGDPNFAFDINVSGEGNSYTMTAGFSPDATDGYDDGLDVYAPPAPPPPAFDAALGWAGDRYYTQILNGSVDDLVEHVFDVQLQYGTDNLITLTWDNTGWSDLGTFILQDAFDGALGIDIDMTTVNSLTLDNPAFNLLKLKVTPSAPEPPPPSLDFAVSLDVTGEGNVYPLTAGFSPDATDGYDDGTDSYAPPAPPPPAFDAALGWNGDRYYTQILAGLPEDVGVEHVFDIQLQYGNDNLITLTWDNTGWSDLGTFILQDAFDGALGIDIDMTVENSLTLDNPAFNTLKLKVTPAGEAGPSPFDEISLAAGWNLISFDVGIENNGPADVFAALIDAGNLVVVTGYGATGANFYDPFVPDFLNTLLSIDEGFGYWVKVNNEILLGAEGVSLGDGFAKDLAAGWNLIGYWLENSQAPADAFAALIDAGNLVVATGYGATGANFYDPFVPDFLNTLLSLDNGFGYWVKVNSAVDGFTYPAAGLARPIASVPQETNPEIVKTNEFMFINGEVSFIDMNYTVGDKVEIRTESGLLVGEMKIVAVTDEMLDELDDFPGFECSLGDNLLMTAPIYGDDWTTEEIDGAIKGENLRFIYNDNEAELTIEYTGTMELAKVDLEFRFIPDAYALRQNYPNPFNPVTTITYDLADAGFVSLKVYNMLGQEVTNLVSADRKAGVHRVQWNGTGHTGHPVSSGVYFYVLNTDQFTSVKKMVFMK